MMYDSERFFVVQEKYREIDGWYDYPTNNPNYMSKRAAVSACDKYRKDPGVYQYRVIERTERVCYDPNNITLIPEMRDHDPLKCVRANCNDCQDVVSKSMEIGSSGGVFA